MSKIIKALQLTQQLIDERLLTGAKAEIIKTVNDKRAWLVDAHTAVLVTQKYTHNLSKRASEMYMIIEYLKDNNVYRIFHNSGHSAVHPTNSLGAMLAGHWEAERSELIYGNRWNKTT